MPDLILLDVNMPGKDGFEVLKEMRADPAIEHIPVIILTAARLDPLDMQTGLNLGADDYMTKPFDRRELLARIRTKLRSKELRGDHPPPDAGIQRPAGDRPGVQRPPGSRRTGRDHPAPLGRNPRGGTGSHLPSLPGKDDLHREYHLSDPGAAAPAKPLPPLEAILEQIHDSADRA